MRSGYINVLGVNYNGNGDTFMGVGTTAVDWSSQASDTHQNGSTIPSAYHLFLTATGVYPSDGPSDRYSGFPLRCLSTVLDM